MRCEKFKQLFVNQSINTCQNIKTNIPFSQMLVDTYLNDNFIYIEKTNDKNDLLDFKRLVNKRLMQVSNDLKHIQELSKDLIKHKENPLFIEAFSKKLIEQCKLQVSRHKDSYKGMSYFFSLVKTEALMNFYRYKLYTEEIRDYNILKSVYLVYFGILKLCGLFEEAWFVLASILNLNPNEGSLYVLEALIIVLGRNMKEFYGESFFSIKEFLINKFFILIDNDAVKVRIVILFDEIGK
ncbi:hypothetical protein COBT_003771 [Conglomerata obtusa]